MERLGTQYGGWVLPKKLSLDASSIVYSGGMEEDISFDLLLSYRYNPQIFLFDPTERARKHWETIQKYYKDPSTQFEGSIQPDYFPIIQNLNPHLDRMNYQPIGLWNVQTELKFFKQTNPNYVSQTVIPHMFGTDYDLIPVDTIPNLMKKFGHSKIDLLKLDIEGAEVAVLNDMLDSDIYPTYLCIEFDLLLKGKDPEEETKTLILRLMRHGYKLLHNENFNMTFHRASQ